MFTLAETIFSMIYFPETYFERRECMFCERVWAAFPIFFFKCCLHLTFLFLLYEIKRKCRISNRHRYNQGLPVVRIVQDCHNGCSGSPIWSNMVTAPADSKFSERGIGMAPTWASMRQFESDVEFAQENTGIAPTWANAW